MDCTVEKWLTNANHRSKRGRGEVRCPQSSPIINVVLGELGSLTLRYADSLRPEVRGRPRGAASLQLFMTIDEEIIGDPELATFVGDFTRNPIVIPFDARHNRKVATFYARWQSRRGETGPWSLAAWMTIAA